MRKKRVHRAKFASILGFATCMSVGCAAERTPINRVQPNAISKHFFVGANLSDPTDDPEFYMRNSVVDVPYGAGQQGLFTATYASPLTRIKWEITEEALIARLTYEHINDTDHRGSRRTNDGQIVALFSIKEHFDIRRDYNSLTGEETNVVGENRTDRPWYQREHFRVDWSKNHVADAYKLDTLSMLGIHGGVKWDPMAYFVEDPSSPDAPVFALDEGYFDLTTKAFATPLVVDTPFGSVPACFLHGMAPITKCDPTEVTLRLAFKRIVDTDYEPIEWDGQRMSAFGYFTTERFGYDRDYGVQDKQWHRFANRYNIWEKSHVAGSQCNVDFWRDADGNVGKYKLGEDGKPIFDQNNHPIADPDGKPIAVTPPGADPNRDLVDRDGTPGPNKTSDECEFADPGLKGSRCDVISRKCTIPPYSRKTRVIPWYFGPGSDPTLFESTFAAIQQWNVAMVLAAQSAKYVEAKRVGWDVSDIVIDEAFIAADNGRTIPNIFVLCHSPVTETDDPACGKAGTLARTGDIRYNLVNIISTPQQPSPWGIMVDGDDPLTGEKVSASVNEWSHVLDIAAQGTIDLVRLINGEASESQVIDGTYMRDWAEGSNGGIARHLPKVLSPEEIQARLHSVRAPIATDRPLLRNGGGIATEKEIARASASLAARLGGSADPEIEGRRQSLMGTSFETMLTTPNMLQAAGYDPNTPTAGQTQLFEAASPLRGMNPAMQSWLDQLKMRAYGQRSGCMLESPEPDGLAGLARLVLKKFGTLPPASNVAARMARDENIHQWLREQFHGSVIRHEIGHSMGLRHNFTGSYDSLNYHKQYWQLRTRNGAEPVCSSKEEPGVLDATTKRSTGDECVGPRWVDPVSEAETEGLIWRWASSTVMDYPGDTTQDMNGLGSYDKAALRFGYADVADVEDDKRLALEGGEWRVARSGIGPVADPAVAYALALDRATFMGIGGRHYSEYAHAYGLLGTCSAPTNPSDPLSATCTGPSIKYAAVRDMKPVHDQRDDPTHVKPFAVDPAGRVRHPYMFLSDEFAMASNIENNRFDTGADAYEKVQFLINSYENRYVFDNFRRGRVMFNTRSAVAAAGGRYFDMIAGVTKTLALNNAIYTELAGKKIVEILNAEPSMFMPLVLGSADGFSMFARILTRPEPGKYHFDLKPENERDLPVAAIDGDGKSTFSIAVGSGQGRYINNDYDFSQGYYWSDYLARAGSTYEKSNAMYYLLEAYNHFVSVDKHDFVDGRWKNINYATIYPDQMRRLFTQIMQNDMQTFAPFVIPPAESSSGAMAEVRYLPWDKWQPLSAPDQLASLEYPKNAVLVDPALGWEQQFRAIVYGFMFGATTLTMDWTDQMRIFTPGGADTVSIGESDLVTFTDPESKIVYAARDYGSEVINGKQVYRTPGARMLQFANSMIAKAYETKAGNTAPQVVYINQIPQEKDPASVLALRRYVSNLSVVREMMKLAGIGPNMRGR